MQLLNVKHLYNATRYSMAGLARAFQGEQAFRHEVLLIPVAVVLLAIVRPGALWSGILLGSWFIVMALELLNSGLEELCNLVSPDYNIHVKHCKDMASAAIFMGLCTNALLWLCMLYGRYA